MNTPIFIFPKLRLPKLFQFDEDSRGNHTGIFYLPYLWSYFGWFLSNSIPLTSSKVTHAIIFWIEGGRHCRRGMRWTMRATLQRSPTQHLTGLLHHYKLLSQFFSHQPSQSCMDFNLHHVTASEDGSMACGICLLNVNKTTTGASKTGDSKLMYGGRQYHSTCANFWCNRVDSVLPSLLPMDSLI
mgnify:FL=1